jgi:hypothetical protein
VSSCERIGRACSVDFFTVETIWLQRQYVLFFIELRSRQIHLAGCTLNPSAPWGDPARPAPDMDIGERPESFRLLIRDWNQKLTHGFDEVSEAMAYRSCARRFARRERNGSTLA